MTRKVIIDCDPGIDDAVALCMALFDPRLEVTAVTAVGGNVGGTQASRNVQAIIEQLDPPRFPRFGNAIPATAGAVADARHIHGEDGLGNSGFDVSLLQHRHPSDELICDEVRAAPNEVTIVCLGPLTNVAQAFGRDPEAAHLVDRLIIMGGSVSGVGNITSTAEFNIYADPVSAHKVFHSPTTKTLIPLEITSQLAFTFDFIADLPEPTTRAGKFLRQLMPYLYRSYHQQLGLESIHLHDAVALTFAVNPELFHTADMAGDVETRGQLTAGMTVFDRRPNAALQPNMEVATEIDAAAVMNCVLRGLAHAGRAT